MNSNDMNELNWRTRIAIGLTVLCLVLVIFSSIAAMSGHPGIASMAMLVAFVALIAIIVILISRLKVTGILAEGDIDAFKRWMDKKADAPEETKTDISELKNELNILKQSVDSIDKKIERISEILEKVAD